jgi:hypothetical protein
METKTSPRTFPPHAFPLTDIYFTYFIIQTTLADAHLEHLREQLFTYYYQLFLPWKIKYLIYKHRPQLTSLLLGGEGGVRGVQTWFSSGGMCRMDATKGRAQAGRACLYQLLVLFFGHLEGRLSLHSSLHSAQHFDHAIRNIPSHTPYN